MEKITCPHRTPPDIPVREGIAHAEWDAAGNTRVITDQNVEGAGATAAGWMNRLVTGLQTQLANTHDAQGKSYGLIPNLLPAIGFQYDPDGFNLANGAKGFMVLRWADEAGQSQTRYYDDASSLTLLGDARNLQVQQNRRHSDLAVLCTSKVNRHINFWSSHGCKSFKDPKPKNHQGTGHFEHVKTAVSQSIHTRAAMKTIVRGNATIESQAAQPADRVREIMPTIHQKNMTAYEDCFYGGTQILKEHDREVANGEVWEEAA